MEVLLSVIEKCMLYKRLLKKPMNLDYAIIVSS